MFEDEYRREMDSLQASDALIADTMAKMQAEQEKLRSQQNTPKVVPTKTRRPSFLKVALPAAACLIIALLGVLVVPQITADQGQSMGQHFEFQPVKGNASLGGDLLFGGIGQQSDNNVSKLKRSEFPEALLPEGILEAEPVSIGAHLVLFGHDEALATYYAVYQEEASGEKWVVLQSAELEASEFLNAVRTYLE